MTDNEVVTGRIVGPFGIKGEVKLVSMTEFPERFESGNYVNLKLANGKKRRLHIKHSQMHKDMLILSLDGVVNRNDAEELRKAEAYVTEEELFDLPAGRYYVFDIIGLQVVTEDGQDVGKVTEVLQGGAHDVYETSTGVLIPAVKEVVLDIDTDSGRIVIRPIPGLIPENG